MTLPELTTKLASLDKSRAALESSYESIEFWLFLFTALVVIGLVVEYREGLRKLLTEWPIDWPHAATMIGAILVVVGVAGELVTEYWASKIESGLQTVSTQTEGLLFSEAADAEKKIADDNRIAKDAAKYAADLGVKVDELPSFVAQKKKEVNDQIDDFNKSTSEKKKQTDELIASLTAKQKEVAATIEAAKKDEVILAASANTINELRQQLRDLTTPRQIDDAHFAALVNALKAFSNVTVEMGLTREADGPDLLIRITDALIEAKWTIKPWSGGGMGLKSSARPNLPDIGDVTTHGVLISILDTDREKLSAPVLALAKALTNSGLRSEVGAFAEKTVDGKPDPLGIKTGIIRIVVGAK